MAGACDDVANLFLFVFNCVSNCHASDDDVVAARQSSIDFLSALAIEFVVNGNLTCAADVFNSFC